MEEKILTKYLTPLNVWALSFGCAVGGGAFIAPGTTELPLAGPLGTAIGFSIGAFAIMFIGWNYLALMRKFPDSGGAFSYVKNVFGYDHGFLISWFALLTYVAIIWANTSGLLLLIEKVFGEVFHFGFKYHVLGDIVYLNEILFSSSIMIILAVICVHQKKIAMNLNTILSIILILGVSAICYFVMDSHEGGIETFKPFFAEDRSVAFQIFNIVAITPWALVGLESISHSTEEFNFPVKRAFWIMTIASILAFTTYTFLAEIAIAKLPYEYPIWTYYIEDLPDLDGIKSVPTLFSASQAMGSLGILILGIAHLSALITGIIAGLVAASRLVYSVSRDGLISKWFSYLNDDGVPLNAIRLVCILGLFAPIFGKTFAGWTIDLLSIGASILYGYISVAAYKIAREDQNFRMEIAGIIGIALSIMFALCLFIPNVLAMNMMPSGSYLILCIWGIAGLAISLRLLNLDKLRRFGRSVIIYVAMLFLIFFSSLMWMRQETNRTTENAIIDLQDFYSLLLTINGVHRNPVERDLDSKHLERSLSEVSSSIFMHSLFQMALIILSLSLMFNIYRTTSEQKIKAEDRKIQAEQKNEALRKHVRTDALTGLLNKSTCEEELTRICRESHGVLMLIDLDSFKLVNDLHGHSMGDEILTAFSQIILEVLTPEDIAGRLGGDEFIAFSHDFDIEMKSRYINERIVEVAEKLIGSDMNIPLGASIGCVIVPESGRDFVDLFKKADKALYSVKQHGKHGFKIFSEELDSSDEASSLTSVEMILSERNSDKHAMLFPLEDFRAIYRLLQRREGLNSNCLLLFTLSKEDEGFLEALQSILRRTDLIMQSSRIQFVAILCDVSYKEMDGIITRFEEDLKHRVPFKCEWSVIK
ncbi:MAG: amino acid permease [Selenomonadaceae bacterium]|nr:amino acid permease [Selenomonadaceae bacterium]